MTLTPLKADQIIQSDFSCSLFYICSAFLVSLSLPLPLSVACRLLPPPLISAASVESEALANLRAVLSENRGPLLRPALESANMIFSVYIFTQPALRVCMRVCLRVWRERLYTLITQVSLIFPNAIS